LLLGNNEFIVVTERSHLSFMHLTQKERFCSSIQKFS